MTLGFTQFLYFLVISTILMFVILIFSYLVFLLKCGTCDDKFTKFLDDNKIYFEIFLVAGFTLMSILVSSTANDISQSTLQAQKDENQPVFRFEIKSNDQHNSDDLIVSNLGAYIDNCNIEPITFLAASDYENGVYRKINIPIQYWNAWQIDPTNQIVLREYLGNGNSGKFSKIITDYYNTYQTRTIGSTKKIINPLGFNESVYVTYKDTYGEEHNELYILKGPNHIKATDPEKKAILDSYNQSLKYFNNYPVSLDNLDAKKVFEIFEEYGQPNSSSSLNLPPQSSGIIKAKQPILSRYV